jgi:hypothetical protein
VCKNSKLLGNFAIYCENGRTKLRLAEQIYNRIRIIAGFDLGTQSKIGTLCGLARGNLKWCGVLDLFSEPEYLNPILIVDWFAQSK